MSSRSLLLRLLLSLCLVFNAVGAGAMAGPTAARPHAMAAQREEIHCRAAMKGMAFAHDTASTAAGKAIPDCCKHHTCRCDCVFVAQAVLPAMPMPAWAAAASVNDPQLASRHASPLLPHLIRPPIG